LRGLGKLRHGCANGDMEVNLQEMWCEVEDSILVIVGGAKWWELVNVVMNLWLPCKAVRVFTVCITAGMCKKFISTETFFFGGRSLEIICY
jgi:3-phosphoglycerate kinase